MVYKFIKGDLLSTDADIICHQVNLQGVMGGGLALSIANKYPFVEKQYRKYEPKVLCEVCFVNTDDFVVANCFSQRMDFSTDYDALKGCLRTVKDYMSATGLKTIAIPYKYGCGIANGDWSIVLNIFNSMFDDLLIYVKE